MDKMVSLFRTIGAAFIEEHVAPFATIDDGLGVAVPSVASVDINLKLFELLGRAALHGLWLIHTKAFLRDDAPAEFVSALDAEIEKTHQLIVDMINNNPVYFTPLKDDHAIEINVTALFLMQVDAHAFLSSWIEQIAMSSIFSFRSNAAYPCVFQDYSDLAQHPKSSEKYQEEATIGSVLYPTLGVWLSIFKNTEGFETLAKFHKDDMAHSTWQMWIPDTSSEEHYYANSDVHGSAVTHLDMSNGPDGLLEQIRKEIIACTEFTDLSPIRFGHWAIVLMASLHHRLPVPPHFWTMTLLPTTDSAPGQSEEG